MAIVSYSQYRLWSTCPLQWKLTSVDKLAPEEPSIHTAYGDAMHVTLQELLRQAYEISPSFAKKVDYSEKLKKELVRAFDERVAEIDGAKVYPCDKFTLQEFYEDGIKIVRYFQDHLEEFADPSEWLLHSIEKPLNVKIRDGVHFRGYLDVVFHKPLTQEYRIVDLKTSVKGWNKYAKSDKTKTDQVILYKVFFAEQFSVPVEQIEVEFIILKQKLYENIQYPQKRVTIFRPSQGKISVNNAVRSFNEFVYSGFDSSGNHILEQKATPSKNACRFCPFRNSPELCDKSAWKGD